MRRTISTIHQPSGDDFSQLLLKKGWRKSPKGRQPQIFPKGEKNEKNTYDFPMHLAVFSYPGKFRIEEMRDPVSSGSEGKMMKPKCSYLQWKFSFLPAELLHLELLDLFERKLNILFNNLSSRGQRNWRRALRLIKDRGDPWERFGLDSLRSEKGIRHRWTLALYRVPFVIWMDIQL